MFDYPISKGTVHNIVCEALSQAAQINRNQDLSQVNLGAHDEVYQAQNPVLVGCDAHSTYCYLSTLEERCDANAWGVHLLDLQEKQGLKPDHTIADGDLWRAADKPKPGQIIPSQAWQLNKYNF